MTKTQSMPRGGRSLERSPLALLLTALLLIGTAASAAAQIVRGQVVDSIAGTPVAFGTVVLLDTAGVEVRRTTTDEGGLFLLRAPAASQYRLRAEGAGYRASTFPPFTLEAEQVVAYRLLVPSLTATAAAATGVDEVLARVCPGGVPEGLPVIVGQVLDVSEQPVPDARVELIWTNVPDVLTHEVAGDIDPTGGGVAVSGSTGFYGVCGAPAGTDITMIARTPDDRISNYVRLAFERGGVTVGDSTYVMDHPIWRQDLTVRSPREFSGIITGAIVDTTGRQIEGARVQLLGTRMDAASNQLGTFRIMGAPAGPARMRIERLGYFPLVAAVDVPARGTVEVPLLRMTPAATQLAPISVEARAEEVRRNLAEFNRRRETTNGSFLTRAEFAEMGNVQVTADVLRRMRGLRVQPGSTINNRWIITSGRGSGRSASDAAGRCFPIVFRDRLYLGNTATVNVDEAVPLVELEAVEVYTSTAGMPAEFNRPGATCGVIAFWTR
jgi:hypothetical protein